MNHRYARLLIISLLTGIMACNTPKNTVMNKSIDHGIEIRYMDTTVRPQDDFYRYVNGKWLDETRIPPDRSRWGSFDELRKQTDLNVLSLLQEAVREKRYEPHSDEGKALTYFQSYLDSTRRAQTGIFPALPYLKQIDALQSKNELTGVMAAHEPYFSSHFMGVYVMPDMKNSKMNVLYVVPAGGGLPEREYYADTTAEGKKIKEKYLQHITRMLQYFGYPAEESRQKAENIMKVETALALNRMTKEERRKPENRYNPYSTDSLDRQLRYVNLRQYLQKTGLETDKVIVTDKNYFEKLDGVIDSFPLETLKDYMRWNVIRSSAGRLTPRLEQADWEFYGKFLEGTEKRMPAEERALHRVNSAMGEAVGKIYVQKYFPPEAKQKAEEMVRYLQKSYTRRINRLTWMSAPTKEKAIEKVNTLTVKIGYPSKWKDYSGMQIKTPEEGGTYFDNSLAAADWHMERMRKKLNRPVDKTEWGMSPQTVNAYYNPLFNEIVFPAAILQPPFFDFQADEAVNYGGMGAVIGHEISHGFDDQGAKFNAEGNFENWWTEEDFKKFNALVEKLARQYDKIEVLPGVFVNGTFTAGENIGDLGGVNAAYTALQMYFDDHGKPGKIQGFTPEQRFFMSWATVWRGKSRPEALKKQIKTDPHAPAQVRGVQPLRNMEEFHRAFDIKKGDKMYLPPEERVKIW